MVAPKNGTGKKTRNGAAHQPLAERKSSVGNAHLTATVPKDVWDELDHAAAWLSGHPNWMNKSRIVTDALRAWLAHLRKTHNEGKPFGPPPNFPGHQPGRPRKHAA